MNFSSSSSAMPTRGGVIVTPRHYWGQSFDDYIDANMELDMDTKLCALKVSDSLVSVQISKGGKILRSGSGTVIECVDSNGTFVSTVATSASLLGDNLTDDIEITVGFFGHTMYKGEIFGADQHYNLTFIIIKSEEKLEAAKTRFVSDFISIIPVASTSVLRRHSSLFNICPGDKIIALGRHNKGNRKLMAAPGVFSVNSAGFDCKELLSASCRITKAGIGGPLVNCHGEVIGLNFYDGQCTPFLPMNVVYKCLEHFKEHGRFLRPFFGMELANLYLASLEDLEAITKTFPNVNGGIIIEEVTEGGPAGEADLRAGDVIIQCGGSIIRSFLELFTVTWSKVGDPLEMRILRKQDDGAYTQLYTTIVVSEVNANGFNSWPLPEEEHRRRRR